MFGKLHHFIEMHSAPRCRASENATIFFFEKHSTDADAHKYACILISMNTRTQPYLYEHLREIKPANPRD